MDFKIGDLVTRSSYNNDVIFKIINIDNNIAILKGISIRLIADSELGDLNKYSVIDEINEREIDDFAFDVLKDGCNLDRSDYFYIPGTVLHIDGDADYLKRSMKFYKKANILAYGIVIKEDSIYKNIIKYIEKTNPNVVVITGHDAYYKEKQKVSNDRTYKNTNNFIKAVVEVRKYEKAHDKLIVVAGACQSNYEELIKAGANFASSPKRVNIHALDPVIIASSICLSEKGKDIDLVGILGKTKYGKEGMGGLKTNGTMYVGYPR